MIRAIYGLYRGFASPLLHALAGPGFGCRFEPTCGCYADEAIRNHGLGRGGLLTLWRVLRCNPWGGRGYDPVPDKLTR